MAESSILKKIMPALAVVIWVIFLVDVGLGYYVNHSFQKGPRVETGDIVCNSDERGNCSEKTVEDLSQVGNPNWVKLVKKNWEGAFLVLLVVGVVISSIAWKTEES